MAMPWLLVLGLCLAVNFLTSKMNLTLPDENSYIRPGLPRWCSIKSLPANAGDARDVGSIPGSGRSPGEGNGSPLQYSCLENSMDRGVWQATVHEVRKSRTWLITAQHMCTWPHLRQTFPISFLFFLPQFDQLYPTVVATLQKSL